MRELNRERNEEAKQVKGMRDLNGGKGMRKLNR